MKSIHYAYFFGVACLSFAATRQWEKRHEHKSKVPSGLTSDIGVGLATRPDDAYLALLTQKGLEIPVLATEEQLKILPDVARTEFLATFFIRNFEILGEDQKMLLRKQIEQTNIAWSDEFFLSAILCGAQEKFWGFYAHLTSDQQRHTLITLLAHPNAKIWQDGAISRGSPKLTHTKWVAETVHEVLHSESKTKHFCANLTAYPDVLCQFLGWIKELVPDPREVTELEQSESNSNSFRPQTLEGLRATMEGYLACVDIVDKLKTAKEFIKFGENNAEVVLNELAKNPHAFADGLEMLFRSKIDFEPYFASRVLLAMEKSSKRDSLIFFMVRKANLNEQERKAWQSLLLDPAMARSF